MKFSIIIPVYNVEKYLPSLLDSILEQSYKNYEIILVDDDSSDSSYSIMEKYEKKNKQIKIFHKQNEGPGLTRKFGYQKSTGDLLFFVDSDDKLANKNVLQKINDIFIENKNIDLLLFEAKRNPDNNTITKVISKKEFKKGCYNVKELDECIVEGCLWMKILRRDLFSNDFFYNSNNYEDFYTTYKYLNNCNNFYYLDEVCYIVNRLEENNSLTKNLNLNKFIKSIDIILEISNFSKLENSVKILGLNYYMFSVKMLFQCNEKFRTKILLIKKLKELKKIFNKDAKKLCKLYFRKSAYFYYLIANLFI